MVAGPRLRQRRCSRPKRRARRRPCSRATRTRAASAAAASAGPAAVTAGTGRSGKPAAPGSEAARPRAAVPGRAAWRAAAVDAGGRTGRALPGTRCVAIPGRRCSSPSRRRRAMMSSSEMSGIRMMWGVSVSRRSWFLNSVDLFVKSRPTIGRSPRNGIVVVVSVLSRRSRPARKFVSPSFKPDVRRDRPRADDRLFWFPAARRTRSGLRPRR